MKRIITQHAMIYYNVTEINSWVHNIICSEKEVQRPSLKKSRKFPAAHGYFGRLNFQYASFNNSRSLHFFLAHELYVCSENLLSQDNKPIYI